MDVEITTTIETYKEITNTQQITITASIAVTTINST
jgi:hypothetical protein